MTKIRNFIIYSFRFSKFQVTENEASLSKNCLALATKENHGKYLGVILCNPRKNSLYAGTKKQFCTKSSAF